MAKILVIEDELHIQNLYEALLMDEYEVDFAINGHEGFRKAVAKQYDLIITDLHMSSWNGAEVIAALEHICPDKKYVIVSGYLHERKFQEILDTIPNIVAQVAKPFTNEHLLETISEALRQE